MKFGETWSLLSLLLCLSCTACDCAKQIAPASPSFSVSVGPANATRQLSLSVKNDHVTLDARNIPHNELLIALTSAAGVVLQGTDNQIGLMTLTLTDVPIDDALVRVSSPLSPSVTRRPDGRWQLAIANRAVTVVDTNAETMEQPSGFGGERPPAQGQQPRSNVQEVYSTDPVTRKPTFSMQEVDLPKNPSTMPPINPQQSRTGLQGDDAYENGQYVAHTHSGEDAAAAPPPVIPR